MKNKVALRLRLLLKIWEWRDTFLKLKRIMWNKKILLWWYHVSPERKNMAFYYTMDSEAMLVMDDQELSQYRAEINRHKGTLQFSIDLRDLSEETRKKVLEYRTNCRKLKKNFEDWGIR